MSKPISYYYLGKVLSYDNMKKRNPKMLVTLPQQLKIILEQAAARRNCSQAELYRHLRRQLDENYGK